MTPQDIIQLENKFYISVNSTYADDRVRVLNHTDTFGIFDRWGDVKQLGEEVQGIYHKGTRYMSDIEFRINGLRPLLLSSAIKEANEILSVDLTNPLMPATDDGDIIYRDTLYVARSKFVNNGSCHECIEFHNYSHTACTFTASISFNADFKDIFEVRGMKRDKRGEVYEVEHPAENQLRLCYRGLDDVDRFTDITISKTPTGWEENNRALFKMRLEAGEKVSIEYALDFLTGDEVAPRAEYSDAKKDLEIELQASQKTIAAIRTSNHRFNQWIYRSQLDLLSLLSETPHGKYPYAGVPWYNTAFGRDGIITALETLWLAPDIGRDVLRFLAHNQATEENAYQDAEPGKILHEVRTGEMVDLEEIPFKRYYGSVDATPLFVVLAGQYYLRTADKETIADIWPNIEAAMGWLENYADTNGDGFFDYQHKSVNGLTNQGWKDSHDSIHDENGKLAVPPIALCEAQGYAYDARKNAAMLAKTFGSHEQAEKWDVEAKELKKRFNEEFWDEELQTFVLAIDGEGKPCRVMASNAGHCLYSGIVNKDKAPLLAKSLLAPDMFNGWGIRTLSSREKRYNPMSYHNGSVWPHDVALIARGFARYGLFEEVLQLTGGLFDASLYIDLQRLPELFCGFGRRRGEGPTDYPVACSPQAWSVAGVFILLESCLRIEIKAAEKRVYFNKPVIPSYMNSIKIDGLRLGDEYASIELYCQYDTVGIRVNNCPAGWKVLLVAE